MEKFRKKLKIRVALLTALILFAVAIGIFDVFFAPEALKDSFMWGFQSGFVTSLGLVAVFALIRMSIIIKDETKIQLQYNKENDERLKAIRAKSGMPMLLITSIAMLIAGVMLRYINEVAFLTLAAAAVCQLLIGIIVKAVNMKRM